MTKLVVDTNQTHWTTTY